MEKTHHEWKVHVRFEVTISNGQPGVIPILDNPSSARLISSNDAPGGNLKGKVYNIVWLKSELELSCYRRRLKMIVIIQPVLMIENLV